MGIEIKKGTLIIGFIFAIFIMIALVTLWQSFHPEFIDYNLNDYSCEDINKGLMEGSCVIRTTGLHDFLLWKDQSSYNCYDYSILYTHYKFRCENNNNLSETMKVKEE